MRIRGATGLAAVMTALLVAAVAAPLSANSQTRRTTRTPPKPPTVFEQGYARGYGDGFTQGQTDWNRAVPRDFQGSEAWGNRLDRFDPKHADSEEYQHGYELGFELGYTDAYFGRARNATVPGNGEVMARAAALAAAQRRAAQAPPPEPVPEPEPIPQTRTRRRTTTDPVVIIPANTELQIKLTSGLNTRNNRVGDKFTAFVTAPAEYEGAEIEGHIGSLNRSGRVTGRTELGLAFDRITLRDGRQGQLSAQLERIIESETVKKVDEEGNVESGSRTRDSQVRGGVGAAAGAIIGGIVGGVKGAVLGAVIGGAAGVGTVYVEGNKDLILEPGTEIVIRTDRPTER